MRVALQVRFAIRQPRGKKPMVARDLPVDCRSGIGIGKLAVSVAAAASTSSPGIAVVGVGEMKVRPNAMEIDLNLSGAAELSADAQVKFRDAKRRVHEAFAALKMKDLAIVEKGVSVTSADAAERMQMMWRGMPSQQTSKTKVAINGVLQLRLVGIRDLSPEKLLDVTSKLLDTARDSGANIGPSAEETANAYRYGGQMSYTMVRFVLEDSGELQKQAYQQAVAQAHGKARQLADLYGVKLGQVHGGCVSSAAADQRYVRSAAQCRRRQRLARGFG